MMTVSETAHPVQIVDRIITIDVCMPYSKLLFVVVQVNWTISRTLSVNEGDVVILSGEAFGIYENEISVSVDCSETIATDVEPGMATISVTDASMLLVGVV